MPPKKDPKCQTRGEFLQHKGAFLDHKKRDKIDVFKGGGGGAGRPAAGLKFCPYALLVQHAARVKTCQNRPLVPANAWGRPVGRRFEILSLCTSGTTRCACNHGV